jgi:hypothetical protein
MQPTKEELLEDMMFALLDRFQMNPEKVATLRGFLRTSRDDLRAAIILYEHGIYSLAVFHLQQAVEKATKAQCLLSGIVNMKEIKKIGHESLRGHQIIASKFSALVKMFAEANPRLDVVPRLDELMEDGKRIEVAKLSSAEIDKILSAYDAQVDSSMLTSLLSPERLGSALSEMEHGRPEFGINDDVSGKVLDLFAKRTPTLVSGSEDLPLLFVASAITFPHSVWTRYPDGDIKPWDYDQSLGIVSRLPDLARRVEKAVKSMESQIDSDSN